MAKVKFKFSREHDASTAWWLINYPPRFKDIKLFSPEIVSIAQGKKFEECKGGLEKALAGMHNSPLIEEYLSALNRAWPLIESEYFTRIERILKKPRLKGAITGYLTTSTMCPYNPDANSFDVSVFYSLFKCLATAGHEIMHLYFHKYYWSHVQKKIGKEKTDDLKEALTVLLNLEFRDLWYVKDEGYTLHKKLRTFIEKKWKQNPHFDILLSECVKYLKK